MKFNNLKINKKILLNSLKFTLSVLIISYLVNYLSINSIYISFQNADKLIILFAFLLLPINIFLQYKRWALLCLTVESNNKINIAKSIFLGIAAGLITPLKAGEFLGRAFIFDSKKIKEYIILSIYDRLISMLVTVLIGFVFALLTFSKITKLIAYYYIPILSIIAILGIFVLFILKNKIFSSVNNRLNQIIYRVRTISIAVNIKLIFLAILFFFTYVFQFALLLAAFNGITKVFSYLSAGVLVFFTNTVIPPITLGELGIREGAAVYYSKHFYYIAQTGFNASIILFTINIIIPSIIGLIIYLREK